jgi:hypothetical protein
MSENTRAKIELIEVYKITCPFCGKIHLIGRSQLGFDPATETEYKEMRCENEKCNRLFEL